MIRRGCKNIHLHLIFPPTYRGQDLAPGHPDKSGPVATASSGLFPLPFLIRINLIRTNKLCFKYIKYWSFVNGYKIFTAF